MTRQPDTIIDNAALGQDIAEADARRLIDTVPLKHLMQAARHRRQLAHGATVSYSPKVFLPVTHLCRDVCRYCTFAKTPGQVQSLFMTEDEVLDVARQGAELGCHEALFTLGDRPEARYRVAREALSDMGHDSTLHYVAHLARRVFEETGLLPHINPGLMIRAELEMLRPVSASMGIMLESTSERLCEKGGPHHGCPDKLPAARLKCIADAGALNIPFTSGILIGIGETRLERIQSLLALRSVHANYGHIQEVIVQNFRAKADTLMAKSVEPGLEDFLWTISMARLILPPSMNIQAPPNLSPTSLTALLDAGINDWGGVSPLTQDFVNPEAPWPEVERLRGATEANDQNLVARLPIYPGYIEQSDQWLNASIVKGVRTVQDTEGFARESDWTAGADNAPHLTRTQSSTTSGKYNLRPDLLAVIERATSGKRLDETEVVTLFSARGREVDAVCESADRLRQTVNGDDVSYVVNRNINYTNVCYFSCRFCAFSKGQSKQDLRGAAYDLPLEEIARRAEEAWARGATEVCLQGGIHPQYTGETYLDVCRAIKSAVPEIHIHAFSPLEVWHGATTLDMSLKDYLGELKSVGLASLPGTAAEILDDEVRAEICPDKIGTDKWLEVMRAAHETGLRTTATIMFGHLEKSVHWARHLLRVRDLQAETGGFTEMVPLPFVHMEAPIHRTGLTRPGPTWREALLMHAVSRLVLNPLIINIQASWVKLGAAGVERCLQAGVNDLGGSLMNESITRAAGAEHGQEFTPGEFEALAKRVNRRPRQRTTLYKDVVSERTQTSFQAPTLEPVINTMIKRQRGEKVQAPLRYETP